MKKKLRNLGGGPNHVPNNGVLAAGTSNGSLRDADFHLRALNTRLLQPITRWVIYNLVAAFRGFTDAVAQPLT